MTVLATTHLRALVAVLAVAALVAVGNTFRSSEVCARPRALLETGAIPGAVSATEHADRYHQSIFQWTEGSIAETGLRFAVLRARVPSDVTRSPTRFVRPRMTPDHEDLAWVEAGDPGGTRLPVHYRANDQAGTVRFATYLFVYEGRPVEDVLPHQLATVGAQLLHGGRPATLLLAWGVVPAPEVARARERAQRWLARAWRHHARVCAPS